MLNWLWAQKTVRFCLALGLYLSATGPLTAHDELSVNEKAEINALIGKYLMDNPDKLAEALDNMQDYYRAQSEQQRSQALKEHLPAILSDERDMRIGPKNAQNIIVEFYDYNCSYCRKNFQDLSKYMNEKGNILFIFKELPILSETSIEAARVALALKDPTEFQRYHARLMQASGRLTSHDIAEAIQLAGANPATVLSASKNEDIAAHIADTTELARKVGITGTPSFVINGTLYEGLLTKADLERILAK